MSQENIAEKIPRPDVIDDKDLLLLKRYAQVNIEGGLETDTAIKIAIQYFFDKESQHDLSEKYSGKLSYGDIHNKLSLILTEE